MMLIDLVNSAEKDSQQGGLETKISKTQVRLFTL